MYKKTIFTLILFLVPISLIEQTKQNSSSEIISKEYEMIEKNNLHLIDTLFEANDANSIEIKNCWEEGDLLSQKRYCSSDDKYFNNF